MDIFAALVLLASGGALLYYGGEYIVTGASSFALRKGVSMLVVGLTVVSIGTSAPELIVSLIAGAMGNTGISVGNIIGSNIANVGLVLGIAALIRPLSMQRSTIRVEIPFVLATSGASRVTVIDGSVSRLDGILYLLLFAGFLFYCFRNRHGSVQEEVGILPGKWRDWAFIVLGIIGLFAGGQFLFVKGSVVFRPECRASPTSPSASRLSRSVPRCPNSRPP
ncbi:MAG: hypothetical protein U5N86_01690 [Planctomycetota bacterium]|nr:hypothetical protein [Planctomycetota bacterium]